MDSLVMRVALFLAFPCMILTNYTSNITSPTSNMTIPLSNPIVTFPTTTVNPEAKPGFYDMRNVLIEKLTENYDPRILPVVNKSHPVQVQYQMVLNQIVELDETKQILTVAVWTRVFWKDEFLRWDPKDYDGIDKTYFSVDTIWRPDIVLQNSVDVERTAFEVFPAGVASVSHSGDVYWPSPIIMQSLCKIKVNGYPFDVQTCPLILTSWSYDGTKLNLSSRSDAMILQNYVTSVEWEVLDVPCQTNLLYYECCPEPYPDVTCSLVMRRRPAFYLFNLVMPTILLLVIGLLVFCLPPESGEKVGLAITILLALSVYMLIVMENVPPNGEAIPMLELFIGSIVGMLTLSTAMAVFVINLHLRGSYSRPPYWMRCCCMFSFLSTLCCLRKEARQVKDEDEIIVNTNNFYKVHHGTQGGEVMSMSPVNNGTGKLNSKRPPTAVSHVKMHNMGTGSATKDTLQQILGEMKEQSKRMTERYQDKKADSLGEAEWRLVAMTMDRLFFVILLILSVIMSLIIFKDVM